MFGTSNDNDESVKKTKTTRELSLFSPVFSSWRVVMAQYYLMTCLVHVFTPVEIALIIPARQPFSSSSFFLLTHFNYSGTQSCAGSRGKKKKTVVSSSLYLSCVQRNSPPPLMEAQQMSVYQQPMTFSHTARHQDISYRVFTKHYLEAKKRVLRV